MSLYDAASRYGRTPQYAGPQRLQERLADQGFTVLGFPELVAAIESTLPRG